MDVSANNLNGDKFSAVTPGRDDEERLDEETPEEDLFNENQGQEKINELSTPLAEDQ